MSFKTRMEDPVRHANHRFRSRVGAWQVAMEESTLRWPTDKELEMEEVCSRGEVPRAHRKERLVILRLD